jgi:hypothetical protein
VKSAVAGGKDTKNNNDTQDVKLKDMEAIPNDNKKGYKFIFS